MTSSLRIQPTWPSLRQLDLTQQQPALLRLAQFLDDHLPNGWQIFVAPTWQETAIDLLLIHEICGFMLFSVIENGASVDRARADRLPQLQRLCTRLLQASTYHIYKDLEQHPRRKHLFKFGIYVSGINGAKAYFAYKPTSPLHVVIGDDDLVPTNLTTVVPDARKCSRNLMPRSWASDIAACLTVNNDGSSIDQLEPVPMVISPVQPQPVLEKPKASQPCPDHSPLTTAVTHRNPRRDIRRRSQAIEEICNQRQIPHLVHFTRLANLSGILTQGLLSRTALEMLPPAEQPIFNDPNRADLLPQSISLSISFPNYRMFFPHRQKNSVGWVVLQLDRSILWQQDCIFCIHNAATKEIRDLPVAERRKSSTFTAMFQDFPEKSRAQLSIPDWFPTDPQAEVLVFNPIEPAFIQAVHFSDPKLLSNWQQAHHALSLPKLDVNRYFFRARHDHRHWQDDSSLFISQTEAISAIDDFDLPF